MDDWSLKISRVDNGFILTTKEYAEHLDEGERDLHTVFEFKDDGFGEDSLDEKKALSSVFTYVADHFGFGHERYKNTNLKVSWDEEGSKYEPSES